MTALSLLTALVCAVLSVAFHLGTRLSRERSLPYLSGAFAALAMVATGCGVYCLL